ncbi:RNAse P Rpr2/Rpp21/SNM1 subunit domain-containing protein [Podospora australis]|uniref:RNAse P Rpr2/Rpp21/SNM1 subunit domain-containing protein n=1 Tax=Podospora australis TaxID=1536484 RepID=A0AAN6WSE0_9PEZI|nr:RNAse P Rpr2/Rpp21/SNM1 subunit domain-containing protein [Podospora australis]
MAKGKAGGGVQNKRVAFLQQAAVLLSSAAHTATDEKAGAANVPDAPLRGAGTRLATDLRAVSLKARIRLDPAVKRSICKFCDSILIDGQSCTTTKENKSKGGKKPWADILARKCHTCGKVRRYPICAPRPRRKTERPVAAAAAAAQG